MNSSLIHRFALLLTILLCQSLSLQAGWKGKGYDRNGLLKINHDFFSMASSTGGDFYFWAPGEFAATIGSLNIPIASDPILLAYKNSNEKFTQINDIPVDSSISSLSIFAGAQDLVSLTLLGPNGYGSQASSSEVSTQTYRHMRIITITEPDPGIWRVQMHGKGSFELAARFMTNRKQLAKLGQEKIELVNFAFVELGGRPGHQGYFKISEPPHAGSLQTCEITISGVIEELNISLVSEIGSVLSKVELVEEVDSRSVEFLGNCFVPNEPFRVLVSGKDKHGSPFQRLTSGLIVPDQIEL